MTAPNVTPRQAQYFAAMAASLERDTGKSLDEWVAIAKTCPEAGHRARLKWFKVTHGLLQNRARTFWTRRFRPSWIGPTRKA